MDLELTLEQQKAVDAATDAPARGVDSSGRAVALLKSADFDRMRELLGDEPDAQRALDARTAERYALVPLERYERYKPFFEEDPPSPEERRQRLYEFGKRAGWDDPAMDVYDEIYGDRP